MFMYDALSPEEKLAVNLSCKYHIELKTALWITWPLKLLRILKLWKSPI